MTRAQMTPAGVVEISNGAAASAVRGLWPRLEERGMACAPAEVGGPMEPGGRR